MIKYLFVILGSVVVENTAFFTTNTALELTAKNNPVLMRLLQTVDAATTDERLLDVSLQLLKSLCLCMRETLKTKQLESSLFSGDTNSLQAEDDTKDPSKKVLELYQNIYNKTCFDLKNEVASKVNKSANISLDEEKDFMLRSDCGKTPIHDGTHIHETQNQVSGTNKDDPRLEDILFQTFIKTRNYHRFRARKYSLYKATEKQIRVPAKHNIIVILTFYPSNDSSLSITNCTKLTDELNNTLLTHSPIDIDIIDARFGQKENVSEESLMPKEATDCTLKSIYTFLLQSERNNKTKVFKLMRRSNTIKVYIDVTSGPNHSDYTKTCCTNRTDVSLCNMEFSNESFDSKEITTYPSRVDKSNNFKETISKIKSLVKLYDKKLKKKKLRRLTTQQSVKQNIVQNCSMTEDNTKVVAFTKKEEKEKMEMSKNPLESVSTSTFLINDAGSKELWMNSIADDESSHEKYKIHNTDISLPISNVHKATVPLKILTKKDNQVTKEEATALHSKLFASSFILPNDAIAKQLLSTEPLNVKDDQNKNVEQSLSETSSYGLQITGTSDIIHSEMGPTASYKTASSLIYNDSRQLTPNKHKSENVNLSYGNEDIITTIVDSPLENTLEIVVTANDKQKKLTFDELFADPNLMVMNKNSLKTSDITINNEDGVSKTSKDPFSKSPFFSICISLSKKTQHTELTSEKAANSIKLSTDNTYAHGNVSQITFSNISFDVHNLTELRITPSISNAGAQQDKIIELETSVTEPWGTNRTVSTIPTEKSKTNNTLPSTSSKDNSINNDLNQLILKSSFVMHTETAALKSYDIISHSIYDTLDGNRFTDHSATFDSIKEANKDLKETVKTTKSAIKDPYSTLTVKEPTNYGETSTVDTAYVDTIDKSTTNYSNRTEKEQNFTIINQSTEIFPYRLDETHESKNYTNSSEGTVAILPKNKTYHLIDMLNVSRLMLDQKQDIISDDAENEKKYSARTKGVSYPYVTDSKNSFEFVRDPGDDKYREKEKINSITGMDAYTMTPTRNLRILLNQSKTTDEMKFTNRNLDIKYLFTGYSETESYTTITFSKNKTKLKSKIEESRFEPEITKQVSKATLSTKAIDASDASIRVAYMNQSSISNNFKNIEESNIKTTDDTQPGFEYSKLPGVGDYVTFPGLFENIIKKDENLKKYRNELIKMKDEINYYEPDNNFNTSAISAKKTRDKSESDIAGQPILNTLGEIQKTFINNSNPNISSEFHPGLSELNDAKLHLQDYDSVKESSYLLTFNKNTSDAQNQEKPPNKFKYFPSSGLTQSISHDTTTYSLDHIEYKTDKTFDPASSSLEILELKNYSYHNDSKDFIYTTKPYVKKQTKNVTIVTQRIVSRNNDMDPITRVPPSIYDAKTNALNDSLLDEFSINPQVNEIFEYLPYTTNQHSNSQRGDQIVSYKDDNFSISKSSNDGISMTTLANTVTDSNKGVKKRTEYFDIIASYTSKSNSINPTLTPHIFITSTKVKSKIPVTTEHTLETLDSAFVDVFNTKSNNRVVSKEISESTMSYILNQIENTAAFKDNSLPSNKERSLTTSVDQSSYGTQFDTLKYPLSDAVRFNNMSHTYLNNQSENNAVTSIETDFNILKPVTNVMPMIHLKTDAQNHHESKNTEDTTNSTYENVFKTGFNNSVMSKDILRSTIPYLYNLNEETSTVVPKDNIHFTNKDTTTISDAQGSIDREVDVIKYPHTDAFDIKSQVYEIFDTTSHTAKQDPNVKNADNAVTFTKTNFKVTKPSMNEIPIIVASTVNDPKSGAITYHESESSLDSINSTFVNVFNTTLNNVDLSEKILYSTIPYFYNENKETSTIVLKDNIELNKKYPKTTISDAQGSIDLKVDALKYPLSDAIDINSQVYGIFGNISQTKNQDLRNQNADNTNTPIKTNHYILKPSVNEIRMIVAPTFIESKFEALNYLESESTQDTTNSTYDNVFNSSFNNSDLSNEIVRSTIPYLFNQNEETSTVVLEDNKDFTKKDTITTISEVQGSIDPEVDAGKYLHSDAIDKNSRLYEIFDNTSNTTNQDPNNQNSDYAVTSTKTIFKVTNPSINEIPLIVVSSINDPKTGALTYHESESTLDTNNSTFVNVFNTTLNNIDLSKDISRSTKPYLFNLNKETSTVVLKDNIHFTYKDTTTISDAQGSIDPEVDVIKYPHTDAFDINSQVYEIFDTTSHTANQDPNNEKAYTTDISIRTNHNILEPSMDGIPIIVDSTVNDSKTDALNHHKLQSTIDKINPMVVNVYNTSFNNIDLSKEILDSTIPYLYNQNEETSTVVLKDSINITKKDTVTTIYDSRGSNGPKGDAFNTNSDAIDINPQVYEVYTTNQDPKSQNTNKMVENDFDIFKANNNMISIIVAPTDHNSKTKVQNHFDIVYNNSSFTTESNPHGSVANNTEDINILFITNQMNEDTRYENKINVIKESTLDTTTAAFTDVTNINSNNHDLSKEISESTKQYLYNQGDNKQKYNISTSIKDTLPHTSGSQISYVPKVEKLYYSLTEGTDISHKTNSYPNSLSEDNILKSSKKYFNIFKTNKDEILMFTEPTVNVFRTETLNYSNIFNINSSFITKSHPRKRENNTKDNHILLTSDRIHVSSESNIDINNYSNGAFTTNYDNLNVTTEIFDDTVRFSTATLKDITSSKDRTPIKSLGHSSSDPQINTIQYLLTDAIDKNPQMFKISDKVSHTTNQYSISQSEDEVMPYKDSNYNIFFNNMSVPPEITQDTLNLGLDIDSITNSNNLHKSIETLHSTKQTYENTSIYLIKLDNVNNSTAKPMENITKSVFNFNIDPLNNAYTNNQYSDGQVEHKTEDINRLLTATFDIPISNSDFQTNTGVIMSSDVVRNFLNMNKHKHTITKSYFNDQSQRITSDLFRDYNNNISKIDDKVSHLISIAKSGNVPSLNEIKTSVYNVFNNASYLYDVTKNTSYTTKPSLNTASSNTEDYLKVLLLNRVNTESSNTDEKRSDLPVSSMIGKTNKTNEKENQFNVPLIKTSVPFKSTFTNVLQWHNISQSTKLFEDRNDETTATVLSNDGYVNSFKPMTNPATVAEIINDSKVNASDTGLTEFDVQSEVHGLPGKIFFTTETFPQSQSYAKTDETYDQFRSDGLESQELNNIKNETPKITAPFNDLLLPSMLSKIKTIFKNEHKLNASSEKTLETTTSSNFEMQLNAYLNESKDVLFSTLIPLHDQNESTITVPLRNNDLYIIKSNTDWIPKINKTQSGSDSMIADLKHLHTSVSYATDPYFGSQRENKTDDILFTVAQLNVFKPNKLNTHSFGIIQSNTEPEMSNAIKTPPESMNSSIKPYSLSTNFTDPSTHYLHDQNEGTAVIEPRNNSFNVPSINSDITFTANITEPSNLSKQDAVKYSGTNIFDKNLPGKVLVTTNSYTSTFTSPPIYEVTTRSIDVSKTFNKSVDSDAVGPINELDLISKSGSKNLVPKYTKILYDTSSHLYEFSQNMTHVTKRYLENIDRDIPYDTKMPVTYYSNGPEAYHTSRISNMTSTAKSADSNINLQNLIGFTSTMMDEMQVVTDKISNESLDLTILVHNTQDIPPSNDSLLASMSKPVSNLPTPYTYKPNAWPPKNFTEKSDIKLYSYGKYKNSTDAKQVEVATDRNVPDNNSVAFSMLDKDQESMSNDTGTDYSSSEQNKFKSIHPENYSQYLQNSNGHFTSIHHNISNINQYPLMTPITTNFPVTRIIKYDTELNESTINNDITPKPLFKKYLSDITLDDTNPYSTNAIKHYTDVEARVTKSPSMIASIPPTYDYLIVSNMGDDHNDMIKNDDHLNTLETITKNIFTDDLSEHISLGTLPMFPDQEKSFNLSREHKEPKTDIPREVLNTNNLIKDVPKITNYYKDTTEYVFYDNPFTTKNYIQETRYISDNNNGSYISGENTGRMRDISDQNTPILVTPNIKFITNFVNKEELMKTDSFGDEQAKMDRVTNPNDHNIDVIQTSANITKSQPYFADSTQTNNSLVVSNMAGKGKETIQNDLTLNVLAVLITKSANPLLADVSYDQASLGTAPYYSDQNENSTDGSQITHKIITSKDEILKMQTTNAVKVVSNMLKKVMVKNDINMNILPTKSNDTYNYSVISDNYFNLSRSTIPYSPNQQKDKINYMNDEVNTSSGLKAPSVVSARSTQFKKHVTRFTQPNSLPSTENINEDRRTKTGTEKITLRTQAFDLNRTKLFSSVNNTLDTIKFQTAKETEQYNPIKLGVDINPQIGVTSSDNDNMLSNYLTEAHTNSEIGFKAGNKTGKKAYLVTASSKERNNVNTNYENDITTNAPINKNHFNDYFVESGITKTNNDLDSENEIELDDIINTKPLNISVFKNRTATDIVKKLQYMDQVSFLESAITARPKKITNSLTQKSWKPSSKIENMLDKTNGILNTMTLNNKSPFFDSYTTNTILLPSVTTATNKMESKTMTLNSIKGQYSSRKTTYNFLPLNVEPLISKDQAAKQNTKPISLVRKPVDDDTGYKVPIVALNMIDFRKPLHFQSPKIATLTDKMVDHQIDTKVNNTFSSMSRLPNNLILAIDDGFTTNTEHNVFKAKIGHSRRGNELTTATKPLSLRGFKQTSYKTKVQEDTTLNHTNLTSLSSEDDFLVPKTALATDANIISDVSNLIEKKLLGNNAIRLSDSIDTLPINKTAESITTFKFYTYNFDNNSTTVKNILKHTLKDIKNTNYDANISANYNTNVNIDTITARVPKIKNSYVEHTNNKLNNKKPTKMALITENIDQETRHSIIVPINIKFNINNSNISRVHDLNNQKLTTLIVPSTIKKRNKNSLHELVDSASIITNNFGIKQKNRDEDDVFTKTIFIINRSTDYSTAANPLKKVKAEESFETYVTKNDTNIKPETGNYASFSQFYGTAKAYTMFLNTEIHPFDNTHSRRTFTSKAKYLESLAEGSNKKNDKKEEKNTLFNFNVTIKPDMKPSKSIVYNTYKALTEEELTLPPDVRKIITTFSTIYTKEMNSSNQIAKLKMSKTHTKHIKSDFISKLSIGNNTKQIKKSKVFNVMKENASIDAFITDTLQLNRKTYLHPIENLPIKIQRKSLKRIKLKNREGSIMAMHTNDFLSFRRAATIRDSVHDILRPHPMPVPKHQMKASNIAKPRRLILRPMFNSFEVFKTNPVVKPIIPSHIIMPDDNDFYRSSFQNHHKPIQSWKDQIGDVRTKLEPQWRSGPIALAQRKDFESVMDVPYYMPSLMKPYFLRDKVESVRSYIYNEEKSPVNTRKHFRSPPRVETSGAVVDAPDSQEHVYYSAGTSREDVTELSSPRVTDYWLDDMYMKVRLPLPINSNPGMVFPRRRFAKVDEVADLAALFIDDLLDYKEMLDRGELPLERATSREKGQPLCMEQFYRLLGVCRVPQLGKDRLELPPLRPEGEQEELVVVACRNYLYPIPVKAADRGRLTPGEIQAQLLMAMVEAASAPAAPRVGLLSSLPRDAWARARDILCEDETNRHNMELISRALCIVCLDEAGGDRADADADTNSLLRAMHGAGTKHHSANRWFDKTVQLIISSDGTVGMCYEHSAAEGVAVVRLAERALARAAVAARPDPPPALLPAPQAMRWTLATDVERMIEQAGREIDRNITDLDLKVYTYRGYGREFMKSCRTSPDVYIQLAMQYAYFKMYGNLVSTYESASLRRFLQGRVDNIRSAHLPAQAWAKAMCVDETPPLSEAEDSQKKEQKKLELFEEAAKKQTTIMEANILGRGIDNHLLALRETARAQGPLPELFTDPTYKQMNEFKLSTSQVATTTDGTFMGYGAVVADGYGCSYNPKKDCVIFCISSFASSSVTNTEAFRQSLEEALDSMKLMFQHRQTE